MSTPVILMLAMALDALAGEPKWLWSHLPHPAVLIGKVIGRADERFNQGHHRKRNGVLLMGALILGAITLGAILAHLGWVVELIIVAILLAQRSLVDHVRSVGDALRMSTGDGRLMVARIVSRDTAQMQPPAIARSAIESAAENLSDGVIAPAFWFLIGGLPGLLAYKVINTADSMIAYRTPRHQDFGWAAAKIDDIANWIPARLTAFLIMLAHGLGDWSVIRRDAKLHRSPNAGWPEAAMADALDVALAGPRAYDGEMRDFPFVHPSGNHSPGPDEIDAACTALWKSWAVFLCLVGLIWIS